MMGANNSYGKMRSWIKHNFKEHIVDSTALLLIVSPISTAVEIWVAGMSDDVSINARILATTLTYAGFGSLFSRVGDLSKKILKIDDKTNEKIHLAHDTFYPLILSAFINPFFYYASGSRDAKEIVIATSMATALSIPSGYPIRLAIDAFRDSTGIQKSERELIRKINPKIKKGLVGLVAAGSIGLTVGIYGLNSTKEDYKINTQSKFQIKEEHNSVSSLQKFLR